MTMAGPAVFREAADDDVGAELADHPYRVGQHPVMAPNGERLIGALGKAEIVGPAEKLFCTVYSPRGEKLLGADEAQILSLLIPNEVLAAVSPGQGEVGRAVFLAVGQVGQQPGVFVVRMCSNIQYAADR